MLRWPVCLRSPAVIALAADILPGWLVRPARPFVFLLRSR